MKKFRLWYPNRSVVVEAVTMLGAECIGQEQFGTWPTSVEEVYPESNKENF
jgi:hypothetical protein